MACNSRTSRLRASYAKSKGMSMPRVHASRTCITVLTSTVAVRCSSSPFVVWPKAVAAVASRTHAASLQPAPPVVRRLPRPGTLQAPARYSCQMPCSEARCVPGLASAPDIPLLVTLPDPVAMGDQRHTRRGGCLMTHGDTPCSSRTPYDPHPPPLLAVGPHPQHHPTLRT